MRIEAGTQQGTCYYYHQNTLGSVAALTNSSGAVAESYEYDPYGAFVRIDGAGNRLAGGASLVGNPYRFTGRAWDGETGLYSYRLRIYDPAVGRFISRDPLGYVDGPGLYQYVLGNPLSLVDPLGLFAPGEALQKLANDSLTVPNQDPIRYDKFLSESWRWNGNWERYQSVHQAQWMLDDAIYGGYNTVFKGLTSLLGMGGSSAYLWEGYDQNGALSAEQMGDYASAEILNAYAFGFLTAGALQRVAPPKICRNELAIETEVESDLRPAFPDVEVSTLPDGLSYEESRFISTPEGQLIEVPPGYYSTTAENGKGLVLLPDGQPLGNNANIIRWGESSNKYPNGYFRYYNEHGQPLNPVTGRPGPNDSTHILPTYQGPLNGYPGK